VLAPLVGAHAEPAETLHQHADVLIVGAGAAGLAAAAVLGASGLRVLLAEQDAALGGGTLLDARWQSWRERRRAGLERLPGVRCLERTTVLGAYGHGVFAALEVLGAAERAAFGGLRERLHVIRARGVLLATGAIERLIAFSGNDVPGVMLAGAALAYLRRYGVAVGRRPVFFINNDEAYEALFALAAAGITAVGVADVRPASRAAERARELGVEVLCGARVTAVRGRGALSAVQIVTAEGAKRELAADCLLISGGFTPAAALATQLGAPLAWAESIAAFVPELAGAVGAVAGAARGVFGLAAAARDGARAAQAIGAGLAGRDLAAVAATAAEVGDAELPADPLATPMSALWEVSGSGKAFVDLQNDVTSADVRLAHREGYEHVEHMKRFTTHTMATDQGRIGGLLGSAILAAARGVPLSEVGQAKARPYVQPVPFAALAGAEVREHFKPKRRLPLHDWHERAGATFVPTGLWLRPLVYARASSWDAVLAEARSVRRAVGITDVSTLGKIDVRGRDAARFLDFIYANTGGRATASCCARTAWSSMTALPRGSARSTSSSPPPRPTAPLCSSTWSSSCRPTAAGSMCSSPTSATNGPSSPWLARARARFSAPWSAGVSCRTRPFPSWRQVRPPSPESLAGCSASPFQASSRTSWRCRRVRRSGSGRRCSRLARPSAFRPMDSTPSTRCASRRVTSRGRSSTATPARRTWALHGC
jgi:sarcosine oxidase subunit alpha